jgi:hypothetical protein
MIRRSRPGAGVRVDAAPHTGSRGDCARECALIAPYPAGTAFDRRRFVMSYSSSFTDDEPKVTKCLVTAGLIILSGALGFSMGMYKGLDAPRTPAAADSTLPYLFEEAARRSRAAGDVETASWFESAGQTQQQVRQKRLGAGR